MSVQPLAVLFTGIPGAGKTTLCTRLHATEGFPVLTASAALAAYAQAAPERVSRWREEYWTVGKNAPDEEVNPVLWEAFIRTAGGSPLPVLLDGYPRTTGQARDFLDRGGVLKTVVLLEVAPMTALRRIGIRSASSGRTDDHVEIAVQRIKREQRAIDALLQLTELRHVLLRLDCERSPVEDACAQILNALAGCDKPRAATPPCVPSADAHVPGRPTPR